jgi:alpha-D-xyloside xylohydrolase
MPYIYSLAGATVLEDGMIMRPLVMDFAKDRKALALSDEYLFGPSILVHPVTEPVLTDGKAALTGATAALFTTYLPAGAAWYDFQTGECLEGGQEYTREYTISEIPVFVKAGAILPFGPDVQYTSEKPWDSLEIAIYPGADGHFTLYEDAGDGYEYEKGEYTTIDLKWNDKQRSLTIGPRQGTFPGMLRERDFVVKVLGGEPVTVPYKGKRVHVRL